MKTNLTASWQHYLFDTADKSTLHFEVCSVFLLHSCLVPQTLPSRQSWLAAAVTDSIKHSNTVSSNKEKWWWANGEQWLDNKDCHNPIGATGFAKQTLSRSKSDLKWNASALEPQVNHLFFSRCLYWPPRAACSRYFSFFFSLAANKQTSLKLNKQVPEPACSHETTLPHSCWKNEHHSQALINKLDRCSNSFTRGQENTGNK